MRQESDARCWPDNRMDRPDKALSEMMVITSRQRVDRFAAPSPRRGLLSALCPKPMQRVGPAVTVLARAIAWSVWALLAVGQLSHASAAEPRHAIAMQGEPALPAGFAAFLYVDLNVKKGGRLVGGVIYTFDSLNPLIVNGVPAISTRGYVIESLLTRNYDEPFTLYGLLANSVETDDARSYVVFRIDPLAKFSDGRPVTAEDVIFSWRLLRDKGRPNYRTYYVKVTKAEATGERVVRFDLAGANDRELPLILGLMPVLPRHATNEDTFEDTTLKPPTGSGPYVIA